VLLQGRGLKGCGVPRVRLRRDQAFAWFVVSPNDSIVPTESPDAAAEVKCATSRRHHEPLDLRHERADVVPAGLEEPVDVPCDPTGLEFGAGDDTEVGAQTCPISASPGRWTSQRTSYVIAGFNASATAPER
jgi:hypothetical protein